MSEPVLKVENLRKEFGGLVAVKDVSFEVGPGEFIGLIALMVVANLPHSIALVDC